MPAANRSGIAETTSMTLRYASAPLFDWPPGNTRSIMDRVNPRRTLKSCVLILSIGAAILACWWSVGTNLQSARILLTESGFYCEYVHGFKRDSGLEFTGPHGRFWIMPGAMLDWPFLALQVPHWAHIAVTFAWFVFPSRRKTFDETHCAACGYNLEGNISGKCSECGAACDAVATSA